MKAIFEGGPHHGEERELPDGTREWRFPAPVPITLSLEDVQQDWLPVISFDLYEMYGYSYSRQAYFFAYRERVG